MTREQWAFALLVLAPITLVMLVALLRGYDITVTFRRERRDKD